MEYVRLLHPKNFDHVRGRFNELSFKKKGEGVSVVERLCAETGCGIICNHARKFYPYITSEPPVFWVFDESALPSGYSIIQTTPSNNDRCHHEIRDVSNNQLWKFFKGIHWNNFEICDGVNFRSLCAEDVNGFSLPAANTLSSSAKPGA